MKHRVIFGLSAALFVVAVLAYGNGAVQSVLITGSLILVPPGLWFFISKT